MFIHISYPPIKNSFKNTIITYYHNVILYKIHNRDIVLYYIEKLIL